MDFQTSKKVEVIELNFLLNEQCLNFLKVIYVAIPVLKQTNNVTINPLFTGGGGKFTPPIFKSSTVVQGNIFWSKITF